MHRLLSTLFLIFMLSTPLMAFEESYTCAHVAGAELAAGDEKPTIPRRFAPSRYVDVLHLKLDVTPDFRRRTVSGTATITFKPIALPLKSLRLDQVDLNIESVTSSHSIQAYEVTDDVRVCGPSAH